MSTFSASQGAKSGVMQRIMSIFVTQDSRKGAILVQAEIFKHTLYTIIPHVKKPSSHPRVTRWAGELPG
jgi:hypothetical protein